MDSKSKTGKVYLQPHKAGKKWKPVWLSLFPHSSSGVGRLEIQDVGGVDHSPGVRRHHQAQDRKMKVVRLCDLINVLRLPPNAEACPMDNMSAFCVETQDRTMVFAALKDECVEWVEKLCQCTFQRGGVSGSDQLHMEENQIYASTGEAFEFWVVVQRTDAATRCGLQGSYLLQVGAEALLLRETQTKSLVREWPYELLRRYGRDKLAFTIEAGRRCASGPGTFTFETKQTEKIFALIQRTIKRKTSPLTSGVPNQGNERVTANIQPNSLLPKVPDVSALLEDKLRTQEKKLTTLEERSEDVVASSQHVSAQPAPITLMPLPLIPTEESCSVSHPCGQSEVVYADPADCIKSAPMPDPTMALYVDPACILPLKPPSSRDVSPLPNSSPSLPHLTPDHPDPVYSEVYDKISPVPNNQTVSLSRGERKCYTHKEPVYTEPACKEEEVTQRSENKPDPFAHLYAQVNKKTSSFGPSPSTKTTPSSNRVIDHALDDMIYENLGVI